MGEAEEAADASRPWGAADFACAAGEAVVAAETAEPCLGEAEAEEAGGRWASR